MQFIEVPKIFLPLCGEYVMLVLLSASIPLCERCCNPWFRCSVWIEYVL